MDNRKLEKLVVCDIQMGRSGQVKEPPVNKLLNLCHEEFTEFSKHGVPNKMQVTALHYFHFRCLIQLIHSLISKLQLHKVMRVIGAERSQRS